MASCAVCRRSILLGGQNVAGVRYCSDRCAGKGQGLGLTPANLAERTKASPVSMAWVAVWLVVAVLAGFLNFVLDLAGWSKSGPVPAAALAASAGYASGPFMLAGLCLLSARYRNLHSFFKVAGIFGVILIFVGIGTISTAAGN